MSDSENLGSRIGVQPGASVALSPDLIKQILHMRQMMTVSQSFLDVSILVNNEPGTVTEKLVARLQAGNISPQAQAIEQARLQEKENQLAKAEGREPTASVIATLLPNPVPVALAPDALVMFPAMSGTVNGKPGITHTFTQFAQRKRSCRSRRHRRTLSRSFWISPASSEHTSKRRDNLMKLRADVSCRSRQVVGENAVRIGQQIFPSGMFTKSGLSGDHDVFN